MLKYKVVNVTNMLLTMDDAANFISVLPYSSSNRLRIKDRQINVTLSTTHENIVQKK